MRALVIQEGGRLVVEDRPVPEPAPGQVLVRVSGAGINRADLLQRAGKYPAPPGAPADIPGLEFAGTVAACGAGVSAWREGDRVFGITGGGAQAEWLVSHERLLARVPERLDWDAAGAVPEAFITAHDALVTQAGMRPGERVLVHAVGSGVGLAAVQLVRAAGAVPYGTARSAEKIQRARELGLEDGVIPGPGLAALADAVARWTGGHGVDIVLDLVGGAYVTASVHAMAERGRLLVVGTMAGGRAELPLGVVLARRLTLRGTVLRSRSLEEKALATRAFAAEVVPLIARGSVVPVVDSCFPLADVARAQERLASNATVGKVVLTVDDRARPRLTGAGHPHGIQE